MRSVHMLVGAAHLEQGSSSHPLEEYHDGRENVSQDSAVTNANVHPATTTLRVNFLLLCILYVVRSPYKWTFPKRSGRAILTSGPLSPDPFIQKASKIVSRPFVVLLWPH
ncbi:hypothetical protein EV356DRAFT_496121 [Viridothelium virens]|uniref:Uncharacterized protein n=1 Tax=Viridothelium virens TaxID=1048519 RepID=A0A6A6HGV1_VIRVR|nr:hypothetical protein EV356DRAFT_496121 [Viridothelium virens]